MRRAMGAGAADLRAMVVRQGLKLLAVGLGPGSGAHDRSDPRSGESALGRDGDRSPDNRGGRPDPGNGCPAGLLRSGPARNQGRSGCRPAVRISAQAASSKVQCPRSKVNRTGKIALDLGLWTLNLGHTTGLTMDYGQLFPNETSRQRFLGNASVDGLNAVGPGIRPGRYCSMELPVDQMQGGSVVDRVTRVDFSLRS